MTIQRKLGVARLGMVEYLTALRLQEAAVRARQSEAIGDTLLILEHPHVFTLGRGADAGFLRRQPAGVDVHRVSRGGQITYHGPGQLVAYPILKLEGKARDVGRYLRDLEAVMIAALARIGIAAGRRDKLTGVWVGEKKIASIGVGLRRWVTFHGFALNVACDLSYFDAIVPCGIVGCEMTSIAALNAAQVSVGSIAPLVEQSFAEGFGYELTAALEPAALWSLIDAGASHCEARSS
ncbi:MAG TPA: lipoyl(octanoyl) transferase LipB [Candidatus Binataceae bacterium]|nr:lipoyl(octanoyl) transferase LipB [Candidatus Binataceae bacterium]